MEQSDEEYIDAAEVEYDLLADDMNSITMQVSLLEDRIRDVGITADSQLILQQAMFMRKYRNILRTRLELMPVPTREY